jgi:tRNA pseudouridine32 synthase/23S rRNA pseudouridine746 synthase
MPSTPPEYIYCDQWLLVANKPAGLLCVPGRGEDKQDCLSSRIQHDFSDALIVHRLDMATSGLVVFARGKAMQGRLSEMFRERLVAKRYVAVVEGTMASDDGEIDLPVGADWPNRPMQKIDAEHGKPSLTRYRVLARNMGSTRVELEPVTGRTHQLRIHMAAIGHPIMGDALYGDATASPRLLLHAQSLAFSHPVTQISLQLTCPAAF